jgi:hypothetical protein
MKGIDVRIHAIRRSNRRRQFEVRWHAAGRARSRSFITRGLADSYRAELVRAARQGRAFDPATGEPAAWAVPEAAATTWLEHATTYAADKWPHLAPHSRASTADALAIITPALTRHDTRPPPRTLQRAALYQHAFNPARPEPSDPAMARTLAWLHRASVPITSLNDPQVLRAALTAITLRQDGTRAAAKFMIWPSRTAGVARRTSRPRPVLDLRASRRWTDSRPSSAHPGLSVRDRASSACGPVGRSATGARRPRPGLTQATQGPA